MTKKMPQDVRENLSRLMAGAAVALGCSCLPSAYAAPEDPVNLIVGTSLRYEDNLFRLSPSTDPRLVLGRSQKSDWISSTYEGIGVEKPYSLQRFQFDATLTAN